MSNNKISDEEIVFLIQAQEFSRLMFIEDIWKSSTNRKYLGFYYFIRYLKQEDTEEILSELVSRMPSVAFAYHYLGIRACEIYLPQKNIHVPRSFNINRNIPERYLRKSVALEPNNSAFHWDLFKIAKDTSACVNSLTLDYKNKKLADLDSKLTDLCIFVMLSPSFSQKEWEQIKTLLLGTQFHSKDILLIHAYFYLDETEECLSLINSMIGVPGVILKEYLHRGLIDKELAISKCLFSDVDNIFMNDHVAIFQAYQREFNNRSKRIPIALATPSRSLLIQKAYRAKEYEKIISLYKQASKVNEKAFFKNPDPYLYKLLASSYIGEKLPKQTVIPAINHDNSEVCESKALHLAYNCRRKIVELEEQYSNSPRNLIDQTNQYGDALNSLRELQQLKHYSYEDLNNELESTRKKWNKAYYKNAFTSIRGQFESGHISSHGILHLLEFGLRCEEYEYLIKNITEIEKSNHLTMLSYFFIASCYEHTADFDNALKYYNVALKEMHQSKEYNLDLIRDHSNFADRLPDGTIPKDKLDELHKIYNIEWVNRFKWNTFIAKNNKLFKYSSFNVNTIDALNNQYFYFASKKQLNDPIELPILISLESNSLVKLDYNICSLSKNSNSMLMWSHYAQEHKGIMIEYCFGGELPRGVGVGSVSYSDDFIRVKEQELYTFNQYILTKNKEWSYEEEIRLFSHTEFKVNFDSYNHLNDNRNKIDARVCSITLGCEFPEDKEQLVRSIVEVINNRRTNDSPKVILRKAYIPESNPFILEYRDISES